MEAKPTHSLQMCHLFHLRIHEISNDLLKAMRRFICHSVGSTTRVAMGSTSCCTGIRDDGDNDDFHACEIFFFDELFSQNQFPI
jgi:hypothetical protein